MIQNAIASRVLRHAAARPGLIARAATDVACRRAIGTSSSFHVNAGFSAPAAMSLLHRRWFTSSPQTRAAAAAETPSSAIKPVRVFVIYYSTYGHVKTLAETFKATLDGVEGVEASLYQVAETLPQEVLGKMHAPPKADHPIITPADLPKADAFIFGFPTRFGTVPAQFKALIDATGGLWVSGALIGKPYGLFTSTSVQNGGNVTTLLSAITNFVHQGMIYVPLGYSDANLNTLDEIHGCSPWGAGTLASPTGSRTPSDLELGIVKTQAVNFAAIAKKLAAP